MRGVPFPAEAPTRPENAGDVGAAEFSPTAVDLADTGQVEFGATGDQLRQEQETRSNGAPLTSPEVRLRAFRTESDLRAAWSRWTWAIGGAALVVRVLAVLAQRLPLFSDDLDYQRLAVSLATGHGWGTSHVAPGGGPTAFRPPLFPLVLSGVYRVFGVHVLAARFVEAVLGSAVVVLLTVLTWLLWGRRVALVAGAIAAVFPPFIMASTSLMSESVALPLELGLLLAIFVYRRTSHIRWAVLSGALLGLLVLTRTEAIVLVVPLVLLAVVRRRAQNSDRNGKEKASGGRPGLRRTLLAPLVVIAAMVVVLAPWEVRDRAVLGSWVPLTTQSGYVLAGTYNHTSASDPRYPADWRPPNEDPSDEALITKRPPVKEVQVDQRLESAALHYATAHPAYLATVFYENTRRLFDLESLFFTRAATYSSYGYLGAWGYAEEVAGLGMLVLALFGIALSIVRRKTSKGSVPTAYWLVPVILWLSTVFQEAFPRLRAMIDPFLVQLGAVTVAYAAACIVRRFPWLRTAARSAIGLPPPATSPAYGTAEA